MNSESDSEHLGARGDVSEAPLAWGSIVGRNRDIQEETIVSLLDLNLQRNGGILGEIDSMMLMARTSTQRAVRR